ncbi:SDR family oxidoreductase [Rhizobium cremeum]|uniref:SDR family oxidoreductase n=1 Tax=Rhizobium cremeum TaxID=2813827 RepID=UPI001FD01801|nr:SDR family oxidoreductase [Rhizobium cremeum]MCJ7996302.1 SDR family oxidoreductase [Rhizobium cremeum]MCJ8001561.1 SDR family oxidoreductase [Rhizobium cremeum]
MPAVTGKVILVTGASGGIGTAVSRHLAELGYGLVLTARNTEKLDALAAGLAGYERGLHQTIAVDMTDIASIAALADEMARRSITLDGVVLMPPQAHSTNDPMPASSAWTELFQNCFIGPLELLKAAIARMSPEPANGRRAKIVLISGISSAQVLGHYATSNVLRCAWLGEAKTLAFALGGRGIHVNTLSLGGTLSPWYKAGLEKRAEAAGVTLAERLAEETSNIPLGKYGEPAEVAVAVAGLLSSFSDHMTGVNIMHDGGFTRAY